MAGISRRIFRKAGRISGRLLLVLLAAVLLLEVLYRHQVVDTYRRELNFLNPDRGTRQDGSPVLVMGDSFSAAPGNWVDELRRLRPDLDLLNAAVPGTGVRQANFMASRRFKAHSPRHFIYQIYLGNDLFDLRYPLRWREAGFFRTLYWAVANRLRGIAWFNYALGQFRAAPPPPGQSDGKTTDAPFSPENYSPRARLYLRAEPGLIHDSAFLRNSRGEDMDDYLDHLEDLLEHCPAGECKVWLLLIPHCAQVSPRYAENMRSLGAEIPAEIGMEEYPFLGRLRSHFAVRPDVRVISALPTLRALEDEGVPAYFNNDDHLSPAGQQAVAELVGEVVE